MNIGLSRIFEVCERVQALKEGKLSEEAIMQ